MGKPCDPEYPCGITCSSHADGRASEPVPDEQTTNDYISTTAKSQRAEEAEKERAAMTATPGGVDPLPPGGQGKVS